MAKKIHLCQKKKKKHHFGSKIECSPSYANYRPETNAVILLDMGHTLRGEHTGGIGKGKEN
jgi:hypothetical protein